MCKTLITGEKPGTYRITGAVTEAELFEMVQLLARSKLSKGRVLDKPEEVALALQTLLMDKPHEVFGLVLLDNAHRLLAFVELFRGTIDAASIYPREVVKEALEHNAAAVILVHNHPSGNPEPSQADRAITKRLIQALATVDIRVLDHLIVGRDGWLSFTAQGLI